MNRHTTLCRNYLVVQHRHRGFEGVGPQGYYVRDARLHARELKVLGLAFEAAYAKKKSSVCGNFSYGPYVKTLTCMGFSYTF